MSKLKKWNEIPGGGFIPKGGNSVEYDTGSWRTGKRPSHNKEKCISCLACWVHCPDSSIIVKDGKVADIDFGHCKGCGICARVCPAKVKAMTMVDE
jgi:pyruvate ferredoxin oxidoreductase delta subunit